MSQKSEPKKFKSLLPQITASTIVSAYRITVGIGIAYSAILLQQLQNEDSTIKVTKTQASWLASVFSLVGLFGAPVGGIIMDKAGRLGLLKISVLPAVVGWVLIATSSNYSMLLIGRISTGLAAVFFASPGTVYITEIASKDMRGSLLTMGPTFVSLGTMLTFLIGWLMNWRFLAWVSTVLSAIPFLLLFLLPESPAWLVSKGRSEEALASLNWLYKYQPNQSENQLKLLKKEMEQRKLEAKTKKSTGMMTELLKPTGYKPLLIISALFFFQQFSGVNIFVSYSVSFFAAIGTTINPYHASLSIGIIRLSMSFMNTWMLKTFTRRFLMVTSALGMAFSTLISGLFTFWLKNGTTDLTWVPLAFLLLYLVTSMIGLATIPWTMTAELFPLKIRGMAHSIAMSVTSIFMFLSLQNYNNMEIAFGGSAGVQWFFSAVSFVAAGFIFVFMPETHGKSLLEIEEYFKHNTTYLGRQEKKRGDKKRD